MAYIISSFAGAGPQFFTNSGAPLNGGLIYTYAAGTTTPATTYTDGTTGTANSNPIVLDSSGRTPNEIWLNSGVLYKFVLKDSTGSQIGSYDNITGINDPKIFNNIITVTGTNTIVGTSVPPITGYVTGNTYSFVVAATNTDVVTLNIDGQGAKSINLSGGSAVVPGELTVGSMVLVEYDGTRFQLLANSSQRSIGVVTGTTAARPATGVPGMMRLNTDTNKFEGYNNSAWTGVGGGATGGGSDAVFVENGKVVTTNYTITSTNNAMSTGPITINTGITVTVPTGCRWAII